MSAISETATLIGSEKITPLTSSRDLLAAPYPKEAMNLNRSKIFPSSSVDIHFFFSSDETTHKTGLDVSIKALESLSSHYIAKFESTMIEKFEVDLYHICEKYHEFLNRNMTLKDLLITYPMFNIERLGDFSEDYDSNFTSDFSSCLANDSLLPVRHKVIQSLCELISALFVKWGVFSKQNYEFRYNIRCQLIKVLDLKKIGEKCFNIETLWFSVAINEGLLPEVATKKLIQYGKLMEEQTNLVFDELLKHYYVCDPSIEDVIGTNNSRFRKRYMNRKPLPLIGDNNYIRLSKPGFLQRKLCRSKNDKINRLAAMIKDLERINRIFEKELVGRFLAIT